MASRGELAPPAAAESTNELGKAGAAHGGAVHIGAGMLGSQHGAAPVPRDFSRGIHLGAMYGHPGELARQVRQGAGRGEVLVGVLRGGPGMMNHNPGTFPQQFPPSAGRGEEFSVGTLNGDLGLVHDNSGTFGHQLVSLLPSGLGAVSVDFAEVTRQPHPGAGRGDESLVGLLPSGIRLGAVYGDSGESASQAHPGAGRAEELCMDVHRGELGLVHDDSSSTAAHQLAGLVPDGLGAVNVDFTEVAPHPHPGAGRGDGLGLMYGNDGTFSRHFRPVAGRHEDLVDLLPDDGLGLVYDISGNFARPPHPVAGRAEGTVATLRDHNLGTPAGHLRRLLPVAGIIASSAAVTGLAAGPGSPGVAFGLFALLLAGLSLVILHVVRAYE